VIRGGDDDLSPSEGTQEGQCWPKVVHPGCCCPEKMAQRRDLVISPSELATEGGEQSVRPSRTPGGGEDAGIARWRCLLGWCSLRVAWPGGMCCLMYTFRSRSMVLQLTPLWVVLSVVRHCTVEPMVGHFGLWDVYTGVGSWLWVKRKV
jgi:hypothetical protein